MSQQQTTFTQSLDSLYQLIITRHVYYNNLLEFLTQHLDSSNDTDDLPLFKKFINNSRFESTQQSQQDQNIIQNLPVEHTFNTQIGRLTNKIEGVLENAHQRFRKRIFNQYSREDAKFVDFQDKLHKISQCQLVYVQQLATLIISYLKGRYQRLFEKVTSYVEKVEQGYDISLRQMFSRKYEEKEEDEEDMRSTKETKHRHRELKIQLQHFEAVPARTKKVSVKRKIQNKSVQKRASSIGRERTAEKFEVEDDNPMNKKRRTAEKMFRFYQLLELNRKQFLEDYKYKQEEREKHEQQLLKKLFDRNKAIRQQIETFQEESAGHPWKKVLLKSSEEEKPYVKKHSGRYIIREKRRRNSLVQESGSATDKFSDMQASQAIAIQSKKTPSQHNKSIANRPNQKVEMLKSKAFDEDIIPEQLQPTFHSPWGFTPLTTSKGKSLNGRFKRRNIPSPMQKSLLGQQFQS